MPSRSDSSYSLTGPTSRSFTHLRVRRAWLQILLLLGFIQMILGILIVTLSLLVTTNIPSQNAIRSSCPIWAGFPLAFSGVVGIVSWRRPFTPVITFFTLLSVLGVMLSLAGSILSCQNAQKVKTWEVCERARQRDLPPLLKEEGWRRTLKSNFPKCFHYSRDHGIPCMASSEPNSGCTQILVVLKDLLFSVCGLTIFAIVVCTLSAIMCCIHIFSVDLLHVLSPPRSSSVTLDCTSPPDTYLPHMLDLDEFVPPIPPPPYYPPEYTCSSETDAQSITYNGSMDSPVPLYPTDFPPSYEAVMGLHGDSQVTLFDSQFTDTSHGPCSCNRVPSVVLSGEGVSVDSGSLAISEIVDLAGDSSPSEDSCLLEASGSACSVDYILFRSIQRSRADYCLSVDCGRCGLHPLGPFEEGPPARLRGERSYSCSTPGTGHEGLLEVGSALTHSCHRLEGLGHSMGPCFPEVRVKAKASLPGRKGPGRQQQQQRWHRRSSESSSRLPSVQGLLVRSHSDPGLTGAGGADGDFQEVFCTKASEEDGSGSSGGPGPCSQGYFLHPSFPDLPPQPRSSGKAKLEVPRKVPLHLSKTAARSLGDLKVCRGSRGLVARFLHRSKRNLATGAAGSDMAGRGGTQGRKQVSRWRSERCSPEGIHLQSCGDLSSTSSLRRLFSARRLERQRPRSLSGLVRESHM